MDLFEMLKAMRDKIEKVGALPTDGEKDNLQKMVADAVALQMKVLKKNPVRKGSFIFSDDDETLDKRAMTSIEKRIVRPASSDFEREIQKWNDDLLLTSAILKSDPRSLGMYSDFKESTAHTELRKALNTTETGAGADWIPTQFSADVIDKIRLELKVAAAFQQIPMPTNPYKMPVVSADATGYFQSQSLANEATKLRASQPTTTNMELSAKKLAARVVFSEEANEDSIVPILPWLKNNVVIAIATAEERAILNGDTATTHQDSNVTNSFDAQKAYNGLRKLTQAGAMVSLSTFEIEYFRNIRKKMGKYGVDPRKIVYIVSISGWIQLLSIKDSHGSSLVTTIDKYGPGATILTGELGRIDGSPIIVSEYIYDNLNASGVYDGVTATKTIMLAVNTAAFVIGDRRLVTVKTDENIETDQQLLVCTQRKDFKSFFDTDSETVVGMGYNLTA